MDGDAWAGVVGAGGVFLFLIVVVWQIAATWRARMLTAREEQYQQLALKYQQLLEDSVEMQRRSAEELAQARISLEAMEKALHTKALHTKEIRAID